MISNILYKVQHITFTSMELKLSLYIKRSVALKCIDYLNKFSSIERGAPYQSTIDIGLAE